MVFINELYVKSKSYSKKMLTRIFLHGKSLDHQQALTVFRDGDMDQHAALLHREIADAHLARRLKGGSNVRPNEERNQERWPLSLFFFLHISLLSFVSLSLTCNKWILHRLNHMLEFVAIVMSLSIWTFFVKYIAWSIIDRNEKSYAALGTEGVSILLGRVLYR